MDPPYYTIPTRQCTELLFGTPSDAIAAGESVDLSVREVDGYARIHLLIQSDQPFTVTYFEGCACEGKPFTQAQQFTSSAVNTADGGTLQVVSESFEPVGPFGFIRIANTGGSPTSQLEVCGKGLPIS